MFPLIIANLILLVTNLKDVDSIFGKQSDIDSIEYHIYNNGDKKSDPDVLTFGNVRALTASSIKPRNATFLYIHGYDESPTTKGPHVICLAHIQYMDCNMIMVDWSKMAKTSYHFESAPSVAAIGNHIATMMKWLERHNIITISDLHIIGYSLGAHIAGHVGKSLAPIKVRRITGLDPAYPAFMYQPTSQKLHYTDAEFVDVLHTNSEFLGIPTPMGHADFYPNYGAWQPGCGFFDIRCSHQLAWKYYAESLSNPYRFLAFKCSFRGGTVHDCQRYGTTVMGYHANPQIHGTFYVKT